MSSDITKRIRHARKKHERALTHATQCLEILRENCPHENKEGNDLAQRCLDCGEFFVEHNDENDD